MRQSNDTERWAASTLNFIDDLSFQDAIEEIGGSYQYFCLVLADFDPLKAEEIFNNATKEQVVKAMMAKRVTAPSFDE